MSPRSISRRHGSVFAVSLALLVSALALPSFADEGQWTPDQIKKLDARMLKERGLELTANQLWNEEGDERTGGLMRAAVNLSGCSAGFVSPQGLVATNHHCAYAAIQANSSVEHDYIDNGFLAREKTEELRATTNTVRLLRQVKDVTGDLETKSKDIADDRERYQAIAARRRELIAECEAPGGHRCEIASFYNGRVYRLFDYLEFTDVRLVYAPPAGIGEFGGEIDNWMWPRHTGDFSLLRVYADAQGNPAPYSPDNVPYQPAVWFPISQDGVNPGDFVGILGYPGTTRRYMPAIEVQRWIEQALPMTVDLYGKWIAVLEARGLKDKAAEIRVAATKKSLANRFKNSQGMLDGLDHMKLLERRREEDAALTKWAQDQDDARYREVLDNLNKISADTKAIHARSELLAALSRGVGTVSIAIDLVRSRREARKPDAQRSEAYTERNKDRLWRRQLGRIKDFDAMVDEQVLALLVESNGALPEGERLAALVDVDAAKLVKSTKLSKETTLSKLWTSATQSEIELNKDPAIVLALALAPEIEALEAEQERLEGAKAVWYPLYFDMLEAVRGGPVYPDANGTLRLSYAKVRGYDKWDGAKQEPQTTLTQAIAKHTEEKPFHLPQNMRDAASSAAASKYADKDLGDLALCMLADGDTTGGNSGSPVIDGKGRLIGLNFDRVWENIGGDYAWFDGHSRNIIVDARFLLWLLDEVEHADTLVAEITGAGMPTLPAPVVEAQLPAEESASGSEAPMPDGSGGATSPEGSPSASPKAAPTQTPGGCACQASASDTGPNQGVGHWWSLSLAVAGMSLLARSRRRRARSAVTAPRC